MMKRIFSFAFTFIIVLYCFVTAFAEVDRDSIRNGLFEYAVVLDLYNDYISDTEFFEEFKDSITVEDNYYYSILYESINQYMSECDDSDLKEVDPGDKESIIEFYYRGYYNWRPQDENPKNPIYLYIYSDRRVTEGTNNYTVYLVNEEEKVYTEVVDNGDSFSIIDENGESMGDYQKLNQFAYLDDVDTYFEKYRDCFNPDDYIQLDKAADEKVQVPVEQAPVYSSDEIYEASEEIKVKNNTAEVRTTQKSGVFNAFGYILLIVVIFAIIFIVFFISRKSIGKSNR